ncbi:MAG: DUF2254 family protein, partial [Pseudomonadota bacterium]|nr:DUF2254 family protein [Pseudomonadota bacterium]
MQIEVKDKPERAIVAGVQLPGVSDVAFESSLIELAGRVKRQRPDSLELRATPSPTQIPRLASSVSWCGNEQSACVRVFMLIPSTETSLGAPLEGYRLKRGFLKALLLKYWDRLRSSFWFVPAVMACLAVALAVCAVELDKAVAEDWLQRVGWSYSGGAEGASLLLGTVAGSMIAIAGTVFSMTLVALSLASS